MQLKTPEEIEKMRRAGEILASALIAMRDAIVPGKTSTLDLDGIAAGVLEAAGAGAPLKGFQPSFSQIPYQHVTCISVNSEVIHAVPRADRIIHDGDLVSLDMDASIDGWCADATISVAVGKVAPKVKKLIRVTREAMYRGIEQARVGNTTGDIGFAIQQYVEKNGFGVVRDMVGHGIGRAPHEPGLTIANFGKAGRGVRLEAGMTFCVEPMVTMGSYEVTQNPGDPWAIVTRDGSWAAHFEHTVAVTEDGPVILTSPAR